MDDQQTYRRRYICGFVILSLHALLYLVFLWDDANWLVSVGQRVGLRPKFTVFVLFASTQAIPKAQIMVSAIWFGSSASSWKLKLPVFAGSSAMILAAVYRSDSLSFPKHAWLLGGLSILLPMAAKLVPPPSPKADRIQFSLKGLFILYSGAVVVIWGCLHGAAWVGDMGICLLVFSMLLTRKRFIVTLPGVLAASIVIGCLGYVHQQGLVIRGEEWVLANFLATNASVAVILAGALLFCMRRCPGRVST